MFTISDVKLLKGCGLVERRVMAEYDYDGNGMKMKVKDRSCLPSTWNTNNSPLTMYVEVPYIYLSTMVWYCTCHCHYGCRYCMVPYTIRSQSPPPPLDEDPT